MQRDYSIDAPAIALTAGTALYMLGAITGANSPVDIVDITVGLDATAAGSLKVELVTWTTDGTGTAYTPKPVNGEGNLSVALTTAKINYTVAPSGTITVLKTWEFPTPSGAFELVLPLGRETTIPVSTKFGLRYTTVTVSPNGYGNMTFEE
jgi:hypothetical protein